MRVRASCLLLPQPQKEDANGKKPEFRERYILVRIPSGKLSRLRFATVKYIAEILRTTERCYTKVFQLSLFGPGLQLIDTSKTVGILV